MFLPGHIPSTVSSNCRLRIAKPVINERIAVPSLVLRSCVEFVVAVGLIGSYYSLGKRQRRPPPNSSHQHHGNMQSFPKLGRRTVLSATGLPTPSQGSSTPRPANRPHKHRRLLASLAQPLEQLKRIPAQQNEAMHTWPPNNGIDYTDSLILRDMRVKFLT
ncbi:hypothetical protein BJX61DRAFT_364999 [Aspergillus egyptiacus]|nr:hypothetical protein BJX61DRAFT_364999 [Aspergillus egyptiacus]